MSIVCHIAIARQPYISIQHHWIIDLYASQLVVVRNEQCSILQDVSVALRGWQNFIASVACYRTYSSVFQWHPQVQFYITKFTIHSPSLVNRTDVIADLSLFIYKNATTGWNVHYAQLKVLNNTRLRKLRQILQYTHSQCCVQHTQ